MATLREKAREIKQRAGQKIERWLIPKLPVNERTFNLLRMEAGAIGVRLRSRLPSSRLSALRKGKHLCVNLGSGHELYEGWLSLDLQTSFKEALAWDLRRSLPFADGSVALVYSSHLLEHLDFSSDAPRLLREILRVLEVGGRVRIVVPDVARWLEAYVHKDDAAWEALGFSPLPACFPTWMAAVNHVFHQNGEHQFGYDAETLSWLLRAVGFSEVQVSSYRTSKHFDSVLDKPEHAPYSLYVEALKGSAGAEPCTGQQSDQPQRHAC